MDDHDKIQSFGDMVNATEKLTSPWRRAFGWTLIATVLTNLFWAVIVWFLVHYAYMNPIDVLQEQNFSGQEQTQSYNQGSQSNQDDPPAVTYGE